MFILSFIIIIIIIIITITITIIIIIKHNLIDILKQIIKQAGDLGMTRDWVWIITDAQTDRVSSGFSLTDFTLTAGVYFYFSPKWKASHALQGYTLELNLPVIIYIPG